MSLLAISDVTIRIAGRVLLDRAALAIEPGRRIGLVGRNGAGKSTLLRAIAGDIGIDGGEIRLAARARLGRVKQEAPSGEGSLLDTVLEGDQERLRLLAEAERAEPLRLAEIHERLRAIGAESAPARAAAILAGLGFDAAAQARPVSSYSGGWRMRVALATALFSQPELLLLDEPTNHLDLEATLWLEGWIARFPGAVLIVSHDRTLLDRAVDGIAHLDRGKLSLTPGGYSEFVRIRTEQAMQQARAAERIAAQRAHMQAYVDRFRYKASKARQAQSRLKALERLPAIDTVVEDTPTRFAFPAPQHLAPPILALDKVAVGYDGNPVLRGLSLTVDMDDRIALLGANGNGKSTLAKLLAGRLDPLSGEIRRSGKLRVGYFAQHQTDELTLDETPLAHMARALPRATGTQQRAQLARFGLDADRAETPVANLSGGEKARLLLALATRDAPQLLLLDEPTNHLDIDAREALVRALADFEGAVLLITHDPHLVDLVADRLWLVADGTVKTYDGDMDSYRGLVAERARPARTEAPTRRDDRRERAEARIALAPLRRRARDAEALIAKLGAERADTGKDARRSRALRARPGGRRHRREHPPRRHRARDRERRVGMARSLRSARKRGGMNAAFLLRHRPFRAFLIANIAERLAASAFTVLLGFQVYQLTHRPLDLGLLGLAQAIPGVSLVLYGGHVADTQSRKRIALVASALLTLLAAAVAAMAQSGHQHTFRLLLLLAFLFGAVRAFEDPAAAGLEAQVVPMKNLIAGISMLATTGGLCDIAGPSLGGLAWSAIGPGATFAIIAALFATAFATVLAGVPDAGPPGRAQGDAGGALRRIAVGVRYVLGDQVLFGSMMLDLFAVFFGGATALLPVFATSILHVGASGFGLLRSATGAGAFVAALTASRLLPQRRAGHALLARDRLLRRSPSSSSACRARCRSPSPRCSSRACATARAW